jgi:hypothetical protein
MTDPPPEAYIQIVARELTRLILVEQPTQAEITALIANELRSFWRETRPEKPRPWTWQDIWRIIYQRRRQYG